MVHFGGAYPRHTPPSPPLQGTTGMRLGRWGWGWSVSIIFRRARLARFFFLDNIYWPLAISPICKMTHARKKPIKQKNLSNKSYPIQG